MKKLFIYTFFISILVSQLSANPRRAENRRFGRGLFKLVLMNQINGNQVPPLSRKVTELSWDAIEAEYVIKVRQYSLENNGKLPKWLKQLPSIVQEGIESRFLSSYV